jgi:hypothetical protein
VALESLPRVAPASPRTSADIEELLGAGEPVVLPGLVERWPIVEAARRGPNALACYLLARDRGAPAPVMEAPAASGGRFGYAEDLREYSFSKRYRPLGETLERIARQADQTDGAIIAIQMLPLAEQLPDVVRDNPMPLLPGEASPKLWLGGAVKTQIHHDRDHNLACVVAGHRRFLLFPPEQVNNLYIGPPDRAPPLSLVDPEAPDLTRFPRFAEALRAARVADLAPGDALLMPRYWWHYVASRAPYNAMINYWWGGAPHGLDDPRNLFLAALLAMRRLPHGERDYWRAMFEAHVFDASGAAVAHLPPALRGHLGALGPAERAALRRQLQAAFLKSV